jgi:hypothetical protein
MAQPIDLTLSTATLNGMRLTDGYTPPTAHPLCIKVGERYTVGDDEYECTDVVDRGDGFIRARLVPITTSLAP